MDRPRRDRHTSINSILSQETNITTLSDDPIDEEQDSNTAAKTMFNLDDISAECDNGDCSIPEEPGYPDGRRNADDVRRNADEGWRNAEGGRIITEDGRRNADDGWRNADDVRRNADGGRSVFPNRPPIRRHDGVTGYNNQGCRFHRSVSSTKPENVYESIHEKDVMSTSRCGGCCNGRASGPGHGQFPKRHSFQGDPYEYRHPPSMRKSRTYSEDLTSSEDAPLIAQRMRQVSESDYSSVVGAGSVLSDLSSVYGELQDTVKRLDNENKDLRKSCRHLKRMFVVLVVFNLFLILCVVTVIPLVLVTQTISANAQKMPIYPGDNDRDKQEASPPSSGVDLCTECEHFDGYKDAMTAILDAKEDNTCCFKSLSDMIKMAKEVAKVEASSTVEAHLPVYAWRNGNGTTYGISHPKIRAAIHLHNAMGNFTSNIKGQEHTMRWDRVAVRQGRLATTYDKTAIEVPTAGLYYVYSVVRYAGVTGGNYTLTHTLYRKRGQYTRAMETVRQKCLITGAMEHNSHLEGMLRLDAKDKIYVTVSNTEYLANIHEAHVFGMFEI